MKKLIVLILILVLVLLLGYFVNLKNTKSADLLVSPSISLPSPSEVPSTSLALPIPSSYLITNVPFQSQAPLTNWDQLHEEACEEASLILAKFWQDGKSALSAQTMEDQIQQMVSWEKSNGYPQDLTVAQLAKVGVGYFKMNDLVVKNNVGIDDIKLAVSQNHPVIVPAAGRLLGNPNFTSPGPVYHMVLVIGYEGNNIIVQDVGTRKGDHYKYNATVFYYAIHDWGGSPDKINQGQKNVLIID